jgi:hypothetical protein
MKYDRALAHFGKQHLLAKAFMPNLTRAAITHWKNTGVVPLRRALELQEMTNGELKVDMNCYDDQTRNPGRNKRAKARDSLSQ